MTVYKRGEKAARGWYIFAIESPGGTPVYSETRGPFKTEEAAREALYESEAGEVRPDA